MPHILDVQTAFPSNYYSQEDLIQHLIKAWEGRVRNTKRISMIHENVKVQGRHLALPLEKYFSFKSFDEKNDHFLKEALALSVQAIDGLLEKNNFPPEQVSSLWSNTVTGFAIPSLEARVMNELPFSEDIKRVPLFGLGCMAGAAGINRVADYLIGHPKEAVIFFSVELCSLTFQLKDITAANLVSTGLFGDGAAAVLLVGDEHPRAKDAPLKWLASSSTFFKDTQDLMGWKVGQEGLKIILSKSIPELAETKLAKPLTSFLESQGLNLSQITSFFAHPGGPKVLTAMEKVFELPSGGLQHSWESLAEKGNMSSVSILDILQREITAPSAALVDTYALSMAMGPAFSAEMGLFKWN